jgi:CRISPR-associated protein Cas1
MLVTGDCAAALETVGLDPQAGYLHTLRPGRPALALDLAEEFRSLLADRLTVALINRRQIDSSDFEERTGGAILLGENGRKKVLAAWQKRKQEEVGHPELARSIPLGLAPMIQARLLARFIRGESQAYVPFVPR